MRADAANVFNRALFCGTNTNPTDSNFGRPTALQIGPRFIQLGMKVNF